MINQDSEGRTNMGLDGVELVIRVEEGFDIVIPDQDAETIRTVRDLCEYVADRIDSRRGSRCLSASAFYHLRRCLAGPLGLAREELRPATRTADLISEGDRRAAWASLEQLLGWRLPPLVRPPCLIWTIGAALSALFLASLLACAADRLTPEVLVAVAFVQFVALVPKGILLARLTRPFATRIPPDCESIRDLVESAMISNLTEIRRQSGFPPAPGEISAKIRALTSEVLGVPPELITPESRFVEDLGAG